MRCIGIDLGTTHSLAAIYENESARLIKNSVGEYLTPSVVSVDKNGEILIGSPARERLITDPKNSVHAFKRMMGSDKFFKIGQHKMRAEELSSLILKSLKADIETELNEEISNVVISVPAYFNDVQRRSTIVATELAGMNVIRLINEPTAASLVYGLQDKEGEKHYLILDLGGGTFDVSILELFEGVFEIHASAGDNYLGGEDFTQAIIKWLKSQPEIKSSKINDAQLYVLAEKAKRELSDNPSALIQINGVELSLSSNDFEKICEYLLGRIRQPIFKAINDAGLNSEDLDEIVLVGGSTKMPIIRQFVTRLFGRFPQSKEDPDTVVALGAAIQAGLLQHDQGLDEIVLTDVMPYSLGIAVYNESNTNRDHFEPIIERNQTIPISRIQTFQTLHENQTEVKIQVFQGESRYVDNNLLLDSFEINFPKKGKIQTFDIRFTYDNNGLLEINAQENCEAGVTYDRIIEQYSGQMSKQEIKNALLRIKDLKIHPRENDINKLVIERIERLYEQNLGENREYLANLMDHFDGKLVTQDPKIIESARKEVIQILDDIEGNGWY